MKTSLSLLSLMLVAVIAIAQDPSSSPPPHRMRHMGPPPGMMGMERDWWRNSEVAQAINLTDQQTQELNQIFSAHKPTLIQLKGNVESEETKFHDLLDQAQPQQDQVLAELTQLQAAHNALEKEFTVMSLAFRSVLSPDQWSKLQTFRRDKMMRFGHRAEPGAPGNSEPSQPQ